MYNEEEMRNLWERTRSDVMKHIKHLESEKHTIVAAQLRLVMQMAKAHMVTITQLEESYDRSI